MLLLYNSCYRGSPINTEISLNSVGMPYLRKKKNSDSMLVSVWMVPSIAQAAPRDPFALKRMWKVVKSNVG